MTTRIIRTNADIDGLARLLLARKLPMTVSIIAGADRSHQQNRLSHLWYAQAAAQFGDRDAEDVRAVCKLHYGVPIMRDDVPAYREQYDSLIKPLSYERKLSLMVGAMPFPVTSLMTTRQMARYLDIVSRKLTEQGIKLTFPDAGDQP